MGKIFVEVCLISARGLGESSSLFWKTQWYAVGWTDPSDKYCTKIDAPGNGNPVWRTKFSCYVEDSGKVQPKDVALQVEVYCRDPIFLREKLHGTATIGLREFLTKRKTGEETGSYQLRKRNSNKPRGFIDISIRVSEGGEDPMSFSAGDCGGLMLVDNQNRIISATSADASSTSYEPHPSGPTPLPLAAASHLQIPNRHQFKPEVELSYTHPVPILHNFSNHSVGGPAYPRASGPSYLPPRPSLPSPLPLPSGFGGRHSYRPTFLQAEYTNGTYINMPSSSAGRGGRGSMGYGAALGAGALGASAVLLGDQIMSGYDFPSGFQDPSLVVSLDPPF